ncbi:hydantoinase/oxoprolinase family protein [Mycolicibacterium frederiksbergense]|nr:hydantoinase/oxoprolinase family protein [Mycolicibacterium frederiksbergense]
MTDSFGWTISIDAGGTFTDAVGRSSRGDIKVAKVASTPDDPSRGLTNAVAALAEDGVDLGSVKLVCHGTTVATNAMLTNSMGSVLLITTEGFRDVLAYRTGSRPQVYSLTPTQPTELVPRERRLEVAERVAADGEVLVELTDDEITRVVEQVLEHQPQAIAVSLLFSYVNPDHENRIGERLRAALPGVPISLSSDVIREFREYPRTATTALNAALRPVVSNYLASATAGLAATGVNSPLQVMQSNGGCVPAQRAAEQAHRLLLSGPAGGVAGLLRSAREHGLRDVISLDMGGTSVDICLVRDGRAPYATAQVINDHTVLAPTVDIQTIGAGGGSVAWVDRTGRLRVGPRSAKAVPGPACYLRGGTEPTLTDAHVVLGSLGTEQLAGGLTLDREAARTAMATIAEPLGMSIEQAAESVVAIAMAHMTRGVRKVSVERGLDPRQFTLFPFGGAGPLHAGLLLRHLGLHSVVVPLRPGLFSADGLLAAGIRVDDAQTVLRVGTEEVLATIAQWVSERGEVLRSQILADGAQPDSARTQVVVDCRYLGQGYEIPVTIDDDQIGELDVLVKLFHAAHEELYGHASADEPVEIVTVRLAGTGDLADVTTPAVAVSTGSADRAELGRRIVHVPGEGPRDTPVFDRDRLAPGDRVDGPAVIAQMDSTTLLLADQIAEVAANLDLVITEGTPR